MSGGDDAARLRSALDAIAGQRVFVVGDAMVDHYVWGEASRISPEAPVPVVAVRERSSCPGGAANVAVNVVAMGAAADLLAAVGADEDAATLARLLEESGVRSRLVSASDRPTTAKTRVIAGSHQVARLDAERAARLTEEVERAVLEDVGAALADADAVLISDYAKGVVTDTVAQEVIAAARERGLPVVVDPKGPRFEKYRGADLITPNEPEARLAAGLPGDAGLDDVVAGLATVLPDTNVLVTRGSEGMSLYADGVRTDVAAISHMVHDVTGAGDTVAAALVVAVAGGVELPLAVTLANLAAAEAVQQVGVARVTLEQLRRST